MRERPRGDDPEPDQDDLGDDITVFLSALPQFVGGVDFDKMTNRQLLAIKNHKPGLWHNKALEELTRRKSSDLCPCNRCPLLTVHRWARRSDPLMERRVRPPAITEDYTRQPFPGSREWGKRKTAKP